MPVGGLDIFVDDEFRSGRRGGGSVAPFPATASSAANVEPAWKHLGTFEQGRKENMQQPSMWAGGSLQA